MDLRSPQIRTSGRTSRCRQENSEARHTGTKGFSLRFFLLTHKQLFTYGTTAQPSTSQQLRHLRRAKACTTLILDKNESFDERAYIGTYYLLAVGSFGRVGKRAYFLRTYVALVYHWRWEVQFGGNRIEPSTTNGVFKERLYRVFAVTTQVTISGRVQRYELVLKGRQETRVQTVHGEGDVEALLSCAGGVVKP